MTSAHLEPAVPGSAVSDTAGRGPSRGRGPGRRAGRRKIAVLEAACRVIADRGADATRFADVAAESGVPVSTLQYYFGSREDLLVAAFRHASSAEIAALEAEVAGMDDPWDQLEKIITASLAGYAPDAPGGGRLWIESWHFGLRDPEMRADALRDNTAWRQLVASVVRRGIELGVFSGRHDAGQDRRARRGRRRRDGHPAVARRPGDHRPRRRATTYWPRCANCSARAVPVADVRRTGSPGQRNLRGRGRVQVTVSCEGER